MRFPPAQCRLLLIDTAFVPDAQEGLLVDLAPGPYEVELSDDHWKLRVTQAGGPRGKRGRKLGKTWTDTAQLGICDYDVFSRAWVDHETSFSKIEPTLRSGLGVAVLDEATGAVMPFVPSGDGDGEYPVYEMRSGPKRIGVEIDFSPVKPLKLETAAYMWTEQDRANLFVQEDLSGNVLSVSYRADADIATVTPEHDPTKCSQLVVDLANPSASIPDLEASARPGVNPA